MSARTLLESHPVPPTHRRTVRSFVRREGRMTAAQRRALQSLWPRYGVEPDTGALDLDALYGRRASRMLEIGFGMGDALLEMAAARSENDYLGIEVYRPGVGSLLRALEERGLENVRVVNADAVPVLERMIPVASLDAVFLFFPDPWPKKRHHKRRLVQPDFVSLIVSRLRPGGMFHMATDWEDYALHMLAVLEGCSDLSNRAGAGCFAPGPGQRPPTKFERRGVRLGHGVWDLVFSKR